MLINFAIHYIMVTLKSGTKKEPKPKHLSSDIFQWGRGLPHEGVGAKKFGMPLETREIKLFWRDIPGFCRDIPGAPEKFEKKSLGSIFAPYKNCFQNLKCNNFRSTGNWDVLIRPNTVRSGSTWPTDHAANRGTWQLGLQLSVRNQPSPKASDKRVFMLVRCQPESVNIGFCIGVSQKGSPELASDFFLVFFLRFLPFFSVFFSCFLSVFFRFLPFSSVFSFRFSRFLLFFFRFLPFFPFSSVFFRFIFREKKKRGDTVRETPFAKPRFAAFEPFSSHEFRASLARTPFCAILWRSPMH